MALSHADRVRLGLDDPEEGEFIPHAGEPSPLPLPMAAQPPATPNLRLVLAEGEKATAPKIRSMVNELLVGNMQQANIALQQLFAANPKVGLETYIELAKFALPQLKAVAVDVTERSGDNPRALSFADLQKMLEGD